MKNDKTNVMRLLDEWGIEYEHFAYNPELVNAVEVAKACKQEPAEGRMAGYEYR